MNSISKPNEPAVQASKKVIEDGLPGNAYSWAWCKIVEALDETDPDWLQDNNKSALDNAVAWIRARKP